MIPVILVDDEMPALKELNYLLSQYDDFSVIGMHMNTDEAFRQIELERPAAVFLDIDMPSNGIEFALKIQSVHPETEIIFVTAHQEYALQAFELQAVDYILKPIASERLGKTIDRLVKIVDLKHLQTKEQDVYIQCFEKLQITKKSQIGISLKWRTNKVKELFAYLICNYGKALSKYDLIFELFNGFDEKKALNNLYVSMYYLRKQLDEFGLKGDTLLLKDDYSLEISKGICDYVDFHNFLDKGPINASNVYEYENIVNIYKGPFLDDMDYLWSISTKENIESRYEDITLLLADYYASVKDFLKCEKVLLQLTELSPYCEEGYNKLLGMYITTANARQFKKVFKALEQLQEELEIVIPNTYKNYFNKIKGLL